METIRHFGVLDQICGVPVTTRNWSTMKSVAAALGVGRTAEDGVKVLADGLLRRSPTVAKESVGRRNPPRACKPDRSV